VDISIQQRSGAFRTEFDIRAPGFVYWAQGSVFSLLDHFRVLTGNDRLLAKIDARWSFIHSNYDFELADGRHYQFRCEKLLKCVYACEGTEEKYHLYQHKGLNSSIFQDDRQIAAFTKNRVTFGKGNQYDVRVNSDANLLVVICMVLVMNTSSENETSSVTFDFGNVGPEERPFDQAWAPD
jgi:uncharacterized protein YxjI